jgi:hypothetical protein
MIAAYVKKCYLSLNELNLSTNKNFKGVICFLPKNNKNFGSNGPNKAKRRA